MTISPYRTPTGWAFDDPKKSIVAEPLISGADSLCDALAEGANQFTIEFSASAPGENFITLVQLNSITQESWYYSKPHNVIVYLCPVLFKYFPVPPLAIYYTVISRG
jgi:hypothetical protein